MAMLIITLADCWVLFLIKRFDAISVFIFSHVGI